MKKNLLREVLFHLHKYKEVKKGGELITEITSSSIMKKIF